MGIQIDADDLQEIVAECDSDGILFSWNAAGEDITGFRREDVIGYHLDTIIAPDSREMLKRFLGFEAAGNTLPGLSVRLRTSFGLEVPAEVTSVPRRSGNTVTSWLLLFRDVTLRVQLQEELDRLDILYRGLVEHSPDIIYVLDASARVVFINDAVESLLGYTKKELVGRELIELVHPEDRQRAYWPLRERRRADRGTRNFQLRLLARDGASRRYDFGFVYVSLSSMGLRPLPGVIAGEERLGTQGIARDITELVVLQQFARNAGLILPVCAVCHRIRVGSGTTVEWVALADYVTRKTGTLFSHTYCPDHVPAVG